MSTQSNHMDIDPAGDIVIKIIEYDMAKTDSDRNHPVLKEVSMRVQSQVLRDSSKYFRDLLGPTFSEGSSSTEIITLKEDTVLSMELWMRHLHQPSSTAFLLNLPILELWNVQEAARKYFLESEGLNSWFVRWWHMQDIAAFDVLRLRRLMYPCFEFGHDKAFAYVTKRLLYEFVGHITEDNPSRHWHLHLTPGTIQQINAARGSTKGKLHKGLFQPIRELLEKDCTCKEKALFSYCSGLAMTDVWPLEEYGNKHSLKRLIEKLDAFRYTPPDEACDDCAVEMKPTVESVGVSVAANFDGLCLTCMDRSQTRTNNADKDYWNHDRYDMWDNGCKFKHGQPTWYFSYMGRKETMDAHRKEKRRRTHG